MVTAEIKGKYHPASPLIDNLHHVEVQRAQIVFHLRGASSQRTSQRRARDSGEARSYKEGHTMMSRSAMPGW
jgi:hypothetical protein